MKQVKCDRKCQSNKDGFCIGMPCFLGKEINDTKSREKIITVISEEASKIIETREPKGLFYLLDNGVHVGIDNRTGDAWTEDFKSKAACSKWLRN